MVSFREYSDDVSNRRIAHAIDEAWQVCLQSHGTPRVLAAFIYKLREDPTWTDDEIRAIITGITRRLQEQDGQSAATPSGSLDVRGR